MTGLAGCSTDEGGVQGAAVPRIGEIVAASTAGGDAFALDGAVVGGSLAVRFDAPDGTVTRVEYRLDAPEQDAPHQDAVPLGVAQHDPFPLLGGDDGRAEAWDTTTLEDGRHTLRADVELLHGPRRRVVAAFVVDNAAPSPSGGGSPRDDEDGAEEEPTPPSDDGPSGGEPAADEPPVETPSAGIWQPRPGTSWQWQLQGTIDTSVDAEVFDVDLYGVPVATIDELHRQGRKVICYFSAGSYEGWRSDADAIPDRVRGKKMSGWDEDWLDVRSIDLLAPVMLGRLDLAAEKGCDAVEPDNVDGYTNDTGFPLAYADQLAYNRFLAREAHARGLAIGLKNDLNQVEDLVDDFDFAVNEECFQWNECALLSPFVEAGKAVFGAEYGVARDEFCPVTNALDMDFILKRLDLGTYRETCR